MFIALELLRYPAPSGAACTVMHAKHIAPAGAQDYFAL